MKTCQDIQKMGTQFVKIPAQKNIDLVAPLFHMKTLVTKVGSLQSLAETSFYTLKTAELHFSPDPWFYTDGTK